MASSGEVGFSLWPTWQRNLPAASPQLVKKVLGEMKQATEFGWWATHDLATIGTSALAVQFAYCESSRRCARKMAQLDWKIKMTTAAQPDFGLVPILTGGGQSDAATPGRSLWYPTVRILNAGPETGGVKNG